MSGFEVIKINLVMLMEIFISLLVLLVSQLNAIAIQNYFPFYFSFMMYKNYTD